MNKRMIAFVIGRILLTEAALLVIPLAVALLYGESPAPFLLPNRRSIRACFAGKGAGKRGTKEGDAR